MKVYDAVANAFIKEGTTTIFGLLGDGQVGWWSSIAKHPQISIVDVREEGAALTMAEGWAMKVPFFWRRSSTISAITPKPSSKRAMPSRSPRASWSMRSRSAMS